MNNIRQKEIEERLKELPKGKLSYKTIKGIKQPYLQWSEGGKVHSYYIKVSERERILLELEEKRALEQELSLLQTYSEIVAEIVRKNPYMKNHGGLGFQSYESFITEGFMYVDKTQFIEEWMGMQEQVTLITRPRRFGKTLLMSMVECFFSMKYEGRRDLFEKTYIGSRSELMELQGSFPTIFVSLANMRGVDSETACNRLTLILCSLWGQHSYLGKSTKLEEENRKRYKEIYGRLIEGDTTKIASHINTLCELLYLHHGKKVIILIDEYDTPLLDAYQNGYWRELIHVVAELFRQTFKNNPYLYRGILTGITRIAKESLFSDMNQLKVHTMLSGGYAHSFGFTENEVRGILAVRDIDEMAQVKDWYDGYTICGEKDIYNPWAISYYLSERKFMPYWAGSGGTNLINEMLSRGSNELKEDFEILINGGSVHKTIDEHVTYENLYTDEDNIWSLLLAAGYFRADNVEYGKRVTCDLTITNKDAGVTFENVFRGWVTRSEYNGFCKSMISGDVEDMEGYLQIVTSQMISYFDVSGGEGNIGAERFYHGLVLGMIVDLQDRYEITSNRESGFGRYDIMMRPKLSDLPGIILEFKVRNPKREATLEEAVERGLKQIRDKNYRSQLEAAGVEPEQIREYCIAFEGKQVMVGKL